MKRSLTTIPTLLLTIFIISVGESHAQAVFDIDRAAKELNVEANVKAEIAKISKDLEPQLKVKQAKLRNEMTNMTRLIGNNPNTEQRQRLVAQLRLLEAEFNQARAQALRNIQTKQAELIKEFTEKIRPIAKDRARKIKQDVIVLKVNAFDYESSADITDDVIRAAVKAGLKMPEPPKEGSK